MTNIAVGTEVEVSIERYPAHVGKDLYVLYVETYMDKAIGYGIGTAGSDPGMRHHPEGWLYYNAIHVEEPRKAGELRVGDKVRVTKGAFTDVAWIGVEGIIEELAAAGRANHKVKLTTSPKGRESRYPVGYIALLGTLELVEEPKPFTYDDIQAGDTIKRVRKHKTGTVETREGTVTAESKTGDYWMDGSIILAYSSDVDNEQVTFELVNRPEPEPEPKLTDGTVKGDQIVVKNVVGTVKVYTRQKNDQWTTLVFPAGTPNKAHRGFTWGTGAIDTAVQNSVESTLIKA